MNVIEDPNEIRQRVLQLRGSEKTVGFVPTMGALHEGHRRVIRTAREASDVLVVSVFVNPTQFDTDRDAEVYPRQFESDRTVLQQESVDLCFHPDYDAMYPEGDSTSVHVDVPLTDRFEGEIRPRFFEGVARIVSKFFNIIPSDLAFFGEKDLQQYLMLKRMVADLRFGQTLRSVPVARDENGVAFSSRNQKFTDEDWEVASRVYDLMHEIKDNSAKISREDLAGRYAEKFEEAGLDLQYLDAVELPEYRPTRLDEATAVLVLAGHVGDVRLKDNLPLHYESVRALESEVDLLTQ
jgi:pantoate--beta-alanine ligase